MAAIDRVVAAVGKNTDDKATLAKDLDGAHVIYVHLDQHTEPRTGKRGLKSIRKDAEALARAIKSNTLAREASKDFVDFDRLCEVLRRAEAAHKGRNPSLTEYLAGELLPAIFERRFGTKPTTSPNGAFNRFAVAVLKELEVACSPDTIIKAMTRFRNA